MATKTVALPVIGKVDQRYVYAGGALVAGIVGYAYMTRGRVDTVVEDTLALGEPEDLGGAGLGFLGEGGTGGQTGEREPGFGFGTNAEWSQFAIDYLGRFGVDQGAASLAIGKFLGREPLDPGERDFVRRAIAVAGDPPVDRPWNIIPAPPPPASQPSTTLPAPASVSARGGKATASITWSAVPGATSYEIRAIAGGSPGTGLPWRNVGPARAWTATLRVKAPKTYAFGVRGRNAAGKAGAERRSGNVRVNP